jgi:hypothetical protein
MTNTTRCRRCGAPLPPRRTRPPLYCSTRCRKLAELGVRKVRRITRRELRRQERTVRLLAEKAEKLREVARSLGGLAGVVRDYGGRTTLDQLRETEAALAAARAALERMLEPEEEGERP